MSRLLRTVWVLAVGLMVAAIGTTSTGARADDLLTGPGLIRALSRGGSVLVVRHASSPLAKPDQATANADNTGLERQLDEPGRASAKAMGEAIRALHIPVGDVLSSPTYRARETVKFAGLSNPQFVKELGDGGQDMLPDAAGNRAAWLRDKVKERPQGRKNTVLITHMPNMNGAFPADVAGLADGETLVFQPDGKGSSRLIARIKAEDWPRLQAGR